jgi:hypothetical protein
MMFDIPIDNKWSQVGPSPTKKPKKQDSVLFDCGDKVKVCSRIDCKYAREKQPIEQFSYRNSKTKVRKSHCKSCDEKMRNGRRQAMWDNKLQDPSWFYSKAYDLISRAKEQEIPYDNREKLASHLEDIWPKDDCCVVTGVKFVRKDTRLGPSVDKIDPDKGYVEGNVRWVTKTYNSQKKDNKLENQLAEEMYVLKNKGVARAEMIKLTSLLAQSVTHEISRRTGQPICFDAKKTTNRNIELITKAVYKEGGE